MNFSSVLFFPLILNLETPTAENEFETKVDIQEVNFEIWNLPNVCDQIDYGNDGRFILNKSKFDQPEKAKEIAKLVAEEMGADERLILLWGTRGSDWHSTSLHLMEEDLKYDRQEYLRYSWSQSKHNKWSNLFDESKPTNSNYWKAKHQLNIIDTFKNNAFYSESYVFEGKNKKENTIPVFAIKHGALDINPIYFTKIWDTDAPPWIACNDHGLIQYIVAVWIARKFQKKCTGKVPHGDSYGVIDAMYARGRCQAPSEKFIKRAKHYGINPAKRAKLGSKWPAKTTDRKEIYEHMKSLAIKKGIIE